MNTMKNKIYNKASKRLDGYTIEVLEGLNCLLFNKGQELGLSLEIDLCPTNEEFFIVYPENEPTNVLARSCSVRGITRQLEKRIAA